LKVKMNLCVFKSFYSQPLFLLNKRIENIYIYLNNSKIDSALND